MPITPDSKDWTWVLERTCPECGFDVTTFPREEVGAMIRDNAAAWRSALDHPDVRRRPADDVWSALEYACHVRDVYALYDERLRRMLEENDPLYENWDQDATALEKRYAEEDPARVKRELEKHADALAERFDRVRGDAWERPGRRSDGARFAVESFARYLIHDPVHHLHDVQRGFDRIGSL